MSRHRLGTSVPRQKNKHCPEIGATPPLQFVPWGVTGNKWFVFFAQSQSASIARTNHKFLVTPHGRYSNRKPRPLVEKPVSLARMSFVKPIEQGKIPADDEKAENLPDDFNGLHVNTESKNDIAPTRFFGEGGSATDFDSSILSSNKQPLTPGLTKASEPSNLKNTDQLYVPKPAQISDEVRQHFAKSKEDQELKEIDDLRKLLKEKENIIHEKDKVIREKDAMIQKLTCEKVDMHNLMREKENVMREKENVMREKDNLIRELKSLRCEFEEREKKLQKQLRESGRTKLSGKS